ncbi:MAG: hypothetical protein J7M11_03765 [Elusimicrobia bacterium]|nr:hypothetical protein [Elusimicrobiota bacterium]
MKDLDKLFRCLEEYIDNCVDDDFFSFREKNFERDLFDEEIKNIFERNIFDELGETADKECCCAVFKTLCRTICLCREMEEMDVPEDIHDKLLKALDSELKE